MVGHSTNCYVLLLILLICNNAQCTDMCKPRDCVDLRCYGISTVRDGPHTVYPDIASLPDPLDISCDQVSAGGGWTVWMRRSDVTNDVDFKQTWEAFKDGFGLQNGSESEFYLGNEVVHQITSNYTGKNGELRIEGVSRRNKSMIIAANMFSLGDEASRYMLHLGVEQVNEGVMVNGLTYHDKKPFSVGERLCQNIYKQHYWWFGEKCALIFLFGPNRSPMDGFTIIYHVMFMKSTKKKNMPLKRVVMLFRPFNETRVCDNPCKNGGTCEYVAANDTTPETYSCKCAYGYWGPNCRKSDTSHLIARIWKSSEKNGVMLSVFIILFMLCLSALIVHSRRKRRSNAEALETERQKLLAKKAKKGKGIDVSTQTEPQKKIENIKTKEKTGYFPMFGLF